MAQTVASYVLGRLGRMGRPAHLRLPGRRHQGVMGALRRAEQIEFVQVRHEEMAAFMACAHAKFTGEVGVCLATSGPGAIHLLNGLYDAKMDHQPVVAIVGQQARAALGGDYQQEVDLHIAVQGRGQRVRAHGRRRRRRCATWSTARFASRMDRAHGHLPHRSERRAGAGRGRRSRRTTHGTRALRASAITRRASCRTTPICSAPPKCSTRARRSRCWSARARWARPTK